MVSTLQKVSDVLTKIMRVVMVVLFIWMVVSLGIQVGARYIFHKSFVWSEESGRYCMIWMVFIGATEIIFNDEHIKVTVIEDLVHGLGKKIVLVLQDIVGLIFSVMLALQLPPGGSGLQGRLLQHGYQHGDRLRDLPRGHHTDGSGLSVPPDPGLCQTA